VIPDVLPAMAPVPPIVNPVGTDIILMEIFVQNALVVVTLVQIIAPVYLVLAISI
jgi:hypothetical protein